jgi:predicted histidine transporter YuiF (NhaC family)
MAGIGRTLMIAGVALFLLGLAITLGLGRLPGDIVVRRGNFALYLPLASSLLLSIVASLLLWLWFRR